VWETAAALAGHGMAGGSFFGCCCRVAVLRTSSDYVWQHAHNTNMHAAAT
jgi:hypothetical protein